MRPIRYALVLALLPAVGGCDELSRDTSVWVEQIPEGGLPSDRPYALRLSLFEFGNQVGGFAEYFLIDDGCNTAEEPYFCPSYCVPFGEGVSRNGEFRIVANGVDSTPLRIQAEVRDPRRLDAIVTAPGGLIAAGVPTPVRIRLVPDEFGDVTRQCPDEVDQADDPSATP